MRPATRLLAVAITALVAWACARPAPPPGPTPFAVAIPLPHLLFLHLYVLEEHTASAEGLRVKVQSFGGESGMTQALASDSVQVAHLALPLLIRCIESGLDVKGFYAGGRLDEMLWFARPPVRRWEDLRGRTIGVPQFGSLGDSLTRVALKTHGLDPDKDVHVVPVGPGPSLLTALAAGRIDAAPLFSPFSWHAEEKGLVQIGNQARDVPGDWPPSLFVAKRSFLDGQGDLMKRFLRAYVAAERLAQKDRDLALAVASSSGKYDAASAPRAYEVFLAGQNERGAFPKEGLDTFWQSAQAMGDVKERWLEARFLDRRFIDSFDEWAPN
jgi:ABC-type nitrate/sulfonate/bicarbonate transport system substrate-binding protein